MQESGRFEFRKKLWFKIASYVFLALISIPIIGLLYLVLSHDYMVLIVRSESMEPTFDMGDVIVLRAYEGGEIEPGKIIAFEKDGHTITHRVFSNQGGVITTKGDAVEDVDQWAVQGGEVKGTYLFKIPYLGYMAKFFRSKAGALVLIVSASLMLIGLFLRESFNLWRSRKGGGETEEIDLDEGKRERESDRNWV